jgi:hypothetical protein
VWMDSVVKIVFKLFVVRYSETVHSK